MPAFEAALAQADPAALEALVTLESRPLLRGLAQAAKPGSPLLPRPAKDPTRVVGVQPVSAEKVAVEVEDAGGRTEWILAREGGSWRLDLAATATRRPFVGL